MPTEIDEAGTTLTTPCEHASRIETIERVATASNDTLQVLSQALLGTMDRPGVVSRLVEQEKVAAIMWKKRDKLVTAISGNGVPGIHERLRILEAVRTRNDRLSWMLISAVIIQGVVLFKDYIVHFGG